jgi:hypothetical protein
VGRSTIREAEGALLARGFLESLGKRGTFVASPTAESLDVIAGLVLVFEGVRRKFLKYLQLSQLSPRTRRIIEWLGMIGTAARGAVFALAGILVVEAAVTYQPAKAGGIDKALLTLRNQPFGEVLLFLAALGLIIFGIYGLCEARWRRV